MRDGERSRRRPRTPVIVGGRPWADAQEVRLKEAAREEASWLFPLHITSSRAARRATLDFNLQARNSRCGPQGAGCLMLPDQPTARLYSHSWRSVPESAKNFSLPLLNGEACSTKSSARRPGRLRLKQLTY